MYLFDAGGFIERDEVNVTEDTQCLQPCWVTSTIASHNRLLLIDQQRWGAWLAGVKCFVPNGIIEQRVCTCSLWSYDFMVVR